MTSVSRTNFLIMKYITQPWNVIRALRLGLGVLIVIQGVQAVEPFLIVGGSIFALLAVFNIGCAGGTCAVPTNRNQEVRNQHTKKHEVEFDEVV